MRCPRCGCEESKVVDSRPSENNDAIRRRRECTGCGFRFTTYERCEEMPIVVIKRDGHKEPFDRQKVMRGLLTATVKRDIPMSTLSGVIDDIESELRDGGIMDTELYDLDHLFDTTFGMTKGERLDYGQSLMTHAMVFMGVDLDDEGRPLRWRVENSWGKDAGKDGYYVMTDRWFDEYTYQVVVNKKYLTDDQRKLLETEPVALKPWDPMGSLAR